MDYLIFDNHSLYKIKILCLIPRTTCWKSGLPFGVHCLVLAYIGPLAAHMWLIDHSLSIFVWVAVGLGELSSWEGLKYWTQVKWSEYKREIQIQKWKFCQSLEESSIYKYLRWMQTQYIYTCESTELHKHTLPLTF